ncbi:MAG: BlaI/MecI/CopY family transcriptional regulator [Planctomycetota bacterium]|jgi:predicted transcriptional regulator
MPRTPSSQPTDVELQILNVLWQRGPSTVRQVHDVLAEQRDRGYSTTLKMLQVMREKGLVVRDDTARPQQYRPARTRSQTQLNMLDDLMQKAFGGSAKKLVLRMLSANRLAAEELAEMQKLIEKAKGEDR